MVLKKRLKKLLIIALVAVTVVWVVVLYLHIQAYNRYIQDLTERLIADGFNEDFIRWSMDHYSPLLWRSGRYFILSALVIFVAWIIVIISTLLYMLKIHKRNNDSIRISSKMK